LNVHKDIIAEDRLAAKRLTGLLDYVDALVRLDERVATRLSQHKLADGSQFILHQHELARLPGTKYDMVDSDGPIWLSIQRLQRSKPPEIAEEHRRGLTYPMIPLVYQCCTKPCIAASPKRNSGVSWQKVTYAREIASVH